LLEIEFFNAPSMTILFAAKRIISKYGNILTIILRDGERIAFSVIAESEVCKCGDGGFLTSPIFYYIWGDAGIGKMVVC